MRIGPLVFNEILEPRPWGGRALARLAGKRLPPGPPVGESWELSDRNTVREGPPGGRTLDELVRAHPLDIVGRRGVRRFPLLVKLIDARQWLSVQVHPDDACARRMKVSPQGKTEAWFFLDVRPGAKMIAGLTRPGVAADLTGLARSGEIVKHLRRVAPKAGDVWFCPAGAVHALGPGLIILEIQQNTDVTFRLYDWGRVGLGGKPRQLHLAESVQAVGDGGKSVTRCAAKAIRGLGFPARRRVACDKFVIDDWRIARAARRTKDRAFEILYVAGGAGLLRCAGWPDVRLRRGLTVLVPACVREYEFVPARTLHIIRSAEGE